MSELRRCDCGNLTDPQMPLCRECQALPRKAFAIGEQVRIIRRETWQGITDTITRKDEQNPHMYWLKEYGWRRSDEIEPVVRLQTIGYTEPDAQARIDAFLAQDENAALIDIRLSPRSRWQTAFNKAALEARYPTQYLHVQELGNLNYKDRTRGIDLLDAPSGTRQLLYLIEHGRSLMLLCACKDYESCHRKVVYELLLAAMAERKANP